jgi:putative drug exporter of the RND superfamily
VFGTLSIQDFKRLGVGLAVAILLDATVIRVLLLPAVMTLLGERNWYLPGWLSWRPQIARSGDVTNGAAAGRSMSEPEGAAAPGLRSEERVTREGGTSKPPEASGKTSMTERDGSW